MDKNIAVFAIFPSRMAAEEAVQDLKDMGISKGDISVLFSSPDVGNNLGLSNSTKVPEGAAAGGVGGAVLGGVLGWLAGIGSLAVPGVGPLIAAGPIMAALSGVGIGGVLGTLGGSLIGMGIPEYEADRYIDDIKKGRVLVSAQTDSRDVADEILDIFEQRGGDDVYTTGIAASGERSRPSNVKTPPIFR